VAMVQVPLGRKRMPVFRVKTFQHGTRYRLPITIFSLGR